MLPCLDNVLQNVVYRLGHTYLPVVGYLDHAYLVVAYCLDHTFPIV